MQPIGIKKAQCLVLESVTDFLGDQHEFARNRSFKMPIELPGIGEADRRHLSASAGARRAPAMEKSNDRSQDSRRYRRNKDGSCPGSSKLTVRFDQTQTRASRCKNRDLVADLPPSR